MTPKLAYAGIARKTILFLIPNQWPYKKIQILDRKLIFSAPIFYLLYSIFSMFSGLTNASFFISMLILGKFL
jgi:hypothetical protein